MRRYIRLLSAALTSVAMYMVGCAEPLNPQARGLLMSGYTAYEKGDDRAVVGKMDEFLRDYSRGRHGDEAYYLRGMARYRLKDLSGSRADLKEALDRTDHRELRAKAHLTLGAMAYKDGDMALSERNYRMALENANQGVAPADQAHYRLGCILQRQGRWKQADVQFDRLIYLFGESDLARRARRHARCTAWTVQAGAFGEKVRAETAVRKLGSEGIDAQIDAVSHNGKLLYIVNVGRHPTYEQAASVLKQVRRFHNDAFVITTR